MFLARVPTDRAPRLLHLRGEGRLAGGDVHVELGSTVAADEDADFERGSRMPSKAETCHPGLPHRVD